MEYIICDGCGARIKIKNWGGVNWVECPLCDEMNEKVKNTKIREYNSDGYND